MPNVYGMKCAKMRGPNRTIAVCLYFTLLMATLMPAHFAICPGNELSRYSVLGCVTNSYPYNTSYYVERFGELFKGYYAYGLLVDDLEGAAQLNRFALSNPDVTLYVQITLPTCDIFNKSQLQSLEERFESFISSINSTNIRYVEFAGPLQEWSLSWTREPTLAEAESWRLWLIAHELTPIAYAPHIESIVPLFAQWVIDITSNISAQFIAAAKSKDPRKLYGFVQYDCVALDADGRIWDLYDFCKKAQPGFVVTHSLALIERSNEGKVLAVVLNAPMASTYRNALGNVELYSPVLTAGVSTSAGDDAYTSYYKYALTEMSTYLNGFNPLILLGPQQKDQLAEFLLNVALYGVTDVPSIGNITAPVLVIRPTYAVGRLSKTSLQQQTLFYSLVTLDVPFVYMSESYVYDHPDELNGYSYVIYASSQITRQMNYILNGLSETVTTIGLRKVEGGLFHSDLPGSDDVKFTRTLENFTAVALHTVFTNASLETALKGDHRVLHYGSNTLRWEAAYVYVNDKRIDYVLDDILGYSPYYPILIYAAILSVSGGCIFALFLYLRRRRTR